MLSDAIHEMRKQFDPYRGGPVEMNAGAVEALSLKLHAFEIEARNMEARLDGMDAVRRHAPILPTGGNIVTFPVRP